MNSIRDLLDSKLIIKSGEGPSRGGRRPSLFSLNLQEIFTIGVQLRKDHMVIAIIDLGGSKIREHNVPFGEKDPDSIVHLIDQAIEAIRAEQGIKIQQVFSVGVAIYGIVDRRLDGIVYDEVFEWDRVPLLEMLRNRIDLPVTIIEESNASAIGEREWGRGRTFKNFVLLHFGHGVGAGIIEGGRLMEGASGSFGEVGHMSLNPAGDKCACGNTGCWHLYTNISLLMDNIRQKAKNHAVDLGGVVELLDQQDRDVVRTFEEFCLYHARGITSIINILDPQAVFISGEIMQFGDHYLKRIKEFVYRCALPSHLERCSIEFASNTEQCLPILGAAYFSLESRLLKGGIVQHKVRSPPA
jgi:predicted NBD/HSP70 family sugar kinase